MNFPKFIENGMFTSSLVFFCSFRTMENGWSYSKELELEIFPCTMTSTWNSTLEKLALDQSWTKSWKIYNILERIILWTQASEAQCNATETISSLSIVNLQKWVRNGLGAVRMCFHTSKHCIFKMWRWVMFLVKYVHIAFKRQSDTTDRKKHFALRLPRNYSR